MTHKLKRSYENIAPVYDDSDSGLTPSAEMLRVQHEARIVACNDILRLFGEKELPLTLSCTAQLELDV